MKKILIILLLPVFALITLTGCRNDRDITDVQKAYAEMVSAYTIGGSSDFFSDSQNPNSIVISYPATVKQAMNNESPSNDLQKRYRGLYYQQEILNNIYTYYSNHSENFYRMAKSENIDQDEINSLYDSVKGIREVLSEFEQPYDTFNDALENGVSDIMEFNITSYTFQLNKVIDASFDFIYKMHDIYSNDCIEDYYSFNAENLQLYVDKAYLDISYIVYLQNIKSFNDSVGDNGICDLSSVVCSLNDYELLQILNERKDISTTILGNLGLSTEAGVLADDAVDLFSHSRDVFEQRFGNYLTTYNKVDVFTINQYKFGLAGNVDYNSYLILLSASDRANIVMLDNFVNDTFLNYVEKLNAIVE